MLTIETIENGAFQSNCYLVINDQKEALVIDPGAEPDRICQTIRNLGVSVVGYPLTHGHMDHIGALTGVHAAFPAPVALHKADAAWAFTPQNAMPPYYEPVLNPPAIAMSYQEAEPVVLGSFNFTILETPGHSPGGVCFIFEEDKIMISGDTLFAGSIGRTDLPGSNPDLMAQSLKKLIHLNGDYTVYPGHGPATTLKREKETNPFLAKTRSF